MKFILILLFLMSSGGICYAVDGKPDMEGMFSQPEATAQALQRDGTPESRIWLGYMVASGLVSSSTYGSATVIYRQALDDYRKDNKDNDYDNYLWTHSAFGFGDDDKHSFADTIRQQTATSPANLKTVRGLFDLIGGTYVPCALLKHKGQEAFGAFGGYWGGGRDFEMVFCDKASFDSLPAIKSYMQSLETFSGDFGVAESYGCWYGTMMRDRPYHQARERLKWVLIPPLALDEDEQVRIRDMQLGLAYWTLLEKGNGEYLKTLVPVERSAVKELKAFYLKQGLNEPSASAAAANAVQLIQLQSYGSFPQSLLEKLRPISATVLNPENALANLQTVSTTAALDAVLSHALLVGKPAKVLEKIEERRKFLDFPQYEKRELEWGEAWLAKAQNAEATSWLLSDLAEHQANAFNRFGKTPLMYAIQRNDIASVKLLLEMRYSPANPNQPTTSLTQLRESDLEGICDQFPLLSAGIRTPLMYAAWHSGPDMVNLLLEHKANPRLTDDNGEKACAYIERNQNASTADKKKMRAQLCP